EHRSRRLRVEIDTGEVAYRELLLLTRGVLPQQCVAANDVHEAPGYGVSVTHHDDLSTCRHLRQLDRRGHAAAEVDHGNLIDRIRLLFSVVAEIELAVDEVVGVSSVKHQ